MGYRGKQQAIQVNRRIRLRGKLAKGKTALAHVGQMVDVIDNRQRPGSKSCPSS